MELKFTNESYKVRAHIVLIVPLWNWNSRMWQKATTTPSSNRTFMELKSHGLCWWCHRPLVLIVPLWNWNVVNQDCTLCHILVLIVPLWNWNSAGGGVGTSSAGGSNRTFMELKLALSSCCWFCSLVLIVPLWNWNTLTKSLSEWRQCVLIVPLWNWNPNDVGLNRSVTSF